MDKPRAISMKSGESEHLVVNDSFQVSINKTDEGIVVDIYDKDGENCFGSTYAYDSEAKGNQ